MSVTGLDVFDRTMQTANIWFEEINSRIEPDGRVAWHVLGAPLRTLHDGLPIGLATRLRAQLPLQVRGACYDWQPRVKPLKLRSAKAFIGEVANLDGTRPVDPETTTCAVFRVLNRPPGPEPGRESARRPVEAGAPAVAGQRSGTG
jgi:uncharacterized protein (DUF2267 family)